MTALFNFLMIAGAIQGFIFNVATFLSRKKIERPVLFLNLFVFFLSLNNLQSWLIDKDFVVRNMFWAQYTIPWYVLIVPMFYAFLIFYLEIGKKRMPLVAISLTIFLLELFSRSTVGILVANGTWPSRFLENYSIIEDVVTLLYSLILFYKAVRLVYFNGALYRPILVFDDLIWIKRFMVFGAGVFLLWMLSIFFNLTEIVEKPYSYYPLRLSSSILIYWVGYQAFFRYVVLKDRISLRKELRKGAAAQKESLSTNLPTDPKNEKDKVAFNQINAYIVENERYLDPDLSLDKLVKELNMGSSKLSMLINTYTSSNFSDYINGLRVEKAKRILVNPDFTSYTIVAIGLECGFNSKSTFYFAFKKFTGLTPSNYKKRQI